MMCVINDRNAVASCAHVRRQSADGRSANEDCCPWRCHAARALESRHADRGVRYLEQRIPGFTQLSVEEQRKLTRVAFLDPEFLEKGIRLGRAWEDTKEITGLSGDEMRDLDEENRHWDELESTVRAFLKGISARNRKERHRLGEAILTMYMVLGRTIDNERYRHLRPLYEDMKRAYMKSRKHRGKRAKTDGDTPKE